jgi:tRNA (guanine-N7-)-methyltransferase
MRRSKRLSLEELAPYLWEPPRPDETSTHRIDWRAVFGNDGPVEIEVGSGKGLFLLNSAMENPETNYFGVEIVRKYQLFTATRMAIRQLRNVRMACADARHLLKQWVPPESVRTIHVYFPDPWWKKRHHKRRVFTEEFVDSCIRALRPGGFLQLATDVPEYFAVMCELCGRRPELAAVDPIAIDGSTDFTNFERKAKLEGRAVSCGRYRRLEPRSSESP